MLARSIAKLPAAPEYQDSLQRSAASVDTLDVKVRVTAQGRVRKGKMLCRQTP